MDRDSWDQSGKQESSRDAATDPQATEAFLAEFAALDLPSQRKRIRELSEAEEENYSENRAPIYTMLMNHSDPEVRRCSVEAMWYYPDEEHLDRILNTFWFDSDEEVRGRAAMVLGRLRHGGTGPAPGKTSQTCPPRDLSRRRREHDGAALRARSPELLHG